MSDSALLEHQVIDRKREEAFLTAFEQVKAFAGVSADENAIDYLLGAYFLFPVCKQSQITTGLPLPFENFAENI